MPPCRGKFGNKPIQRCPDSFTDDEERGKAPFTPRRSARDLLRSASANYLRVRE